ncbi:MAG: hypothetical protein GQ544_02560 [Candidatus Aminicenantes bacterium]|nr:hypothetical protein [Candidatus Aminicenantes bacterium]
MRCKHHRENIVLYLYGELSDQKSRELENHLETCSKCAQDIAYTREVFHLMEEADTQTQPQPNWEKCWGTIHSEIRKQPKSPKRAMLFPRWVPAAAAVILVFALGIYLGRFWPSSQPQITAQEESVIPETETGGFAQATLVQHFESLKPLLIDYANFTVTETEEDNKIVIDRSIIRNLLIQNYLLLRMVAQDNPEAAELLEDIDLVLREIKNLENGDPGASRMIRELIQHRKILFKIDVLQQL